MISLTLLTMSCVTRTKIEYVYEDYDVVFPQFPEPVSVSFNEETETVSMPLWYWEKVAEYKVEVDAIQKYFEELKKLKKE